MSIDINWEALTSGTDGHALAEKIRDFIHTKFQDITLPRFIRSVQVHSFDFGSTCPEVEIKDICDPLPDFYDNDDDEDEDANSGSGEDADAEPSKLLERNDAPPRPPAQVVDPTTSERHDGNTARRPALDALFRRPSQIDAWQARFRFAGPEGHIPTPSLGANTPGIPGGTSNLGYFQSPLSTLSGAQTPLAAVAGRQLRDDCGVGKYNALPKGTTGHVVADSGKPMAQRGSLSGGVSNSTGYRFDARRPIGNTSTGFDHARQAEAKQGIRSTESPTSSSHKTEARPEDLQVVCRVRYSGNIKLSLTAEILLDYPMPSFLGIPLRLNITGLSFDGVAITAWIRGRAHFCFLSAEDASALLGEDVVADSPQQGGAASDRFGARKPSNAGGLLQDIRVESEIGQMENGKQSLRNVGKVERFVLEQVRKIFEEELVYPSFWTFLI